MKMTTGPESKQTGIRPIPFDWEVRTIGQLGRIITGKTPRTKNKDNFGYEYPFITPRDMKGQKHVFETERYLSNKGKDTVRNCVIPERSVCVSCIGSDMGKVVMATRDSMTNQQINSVIPNFPADFVYYAILNISPHLRNLGKQSTAVPILNKTQFSSVEVTVPSRPSEAVVISKILSDLDSRIELNQQMNKTLEAIAQAIFKHWFIDFEFPDEDGRPYKSAGGEMVHSSELASLIPKEWVSRHLGDVLSLLKDGTHLPPKRTEFGIRFIAGASDVKHLEVDFTGCTYITNSDYASIHKYWKVQAKDVLLTIVGTVGNVAIVKEEDLPFSLQRSIAVLRAGERVSYSYLYFLLNSWRFKQYLLSCMNPTAQPGIYLGTLSRFEVCVPPKKTMAEFDRLVEPMIVRMQRSNSESHILSQIRDSLLPRLMSGKIRVPVSDDRG